MHFDQFAGDYKQVLDRSVSISGDESEYFAEYKARYLARVLGSGFSGKILDFGCGVGLLSAFMHQHLANARIDGFDVSAESIGQVDPVLHGQGLFTANSGELARDYNLVVVANVMHHIEPPDRQAAINDMTQRLAPTGKLTVFEHNPGNPVTRWVVEHCPFDEGVTLLPPSETSGYLANAGLKLLRRDYIVFMPRLLSWLRGLETSLASLPLGAQYVIMGEQRG